MRMLVALALVLAPLAAWAGPEIIVVDASAGVTACELEQSLDGGTSWTALTPRATPTAGQCVFTVSAPSGRSLYRWAYFFGTTRMLRTDAGVYLCASLPDCPFASSPVNVGVK